MAGIACKTGSHMIKSNKSPTGAQSGQPTKEPAFVSGYLPYLLAHASHLLSGDFHGFLRENKVPVSTWRVLATLSDGGGMTVGELARIGLYNQPTATKIIDRLVLDGVVERRRDDRDRRRILLFITPEGRLLVDGLVEAAKEHEAVATANFSAQEVENFKAMLRHLIARLE